MTVRLLLWSCARYLYKILLPWWYQWTGPILTLENGIQVRVGHQIVQGGFSVVYTATLVHHPNGNQNDENNSYNNHRRYRDDDKNSDHGLNDDDKTDHHPADLESAIHCEENKEDETDFWNNHHSNCTTTEYALKRICLGNDAELKQACFQEANVHAAVAHHPHNMPLLGFLQTKEYCYTFVVIPYDTT